MENSLSRAARDYLNELLHAFHLFSPRKKAVFLALLALFVGAVAGIVWIVDQSITVAVPAYAGTLREGEIGVPRFINPLLATSDPDRDMSALIYAGLMRANATGSLIPALAESYTISDDSLTYTFTLRNNLTWHDGKPLTSDDILFTVQKAQDPALKSPVRAQWEGVTAQAPDATHVVFTLKHPYALFLENTTLGILPKHIWQKVSTDSFPYSIKNTEPIGSGPYQYVSMKKDGSGIPTQYSLKAFSKYALGKPYISHLEFRLYPSDQARIAGYKAGQIDAMSTITPETATSTKGNGALYVSINPLPRIFAVFFNQNNAQIFTSQTVREALERAVNKEALIQTAIGGYATSTDGPLPPGSFGYTPDTSTLPGDIAAAKAMLEKNGWVLDPKTKVYSKTTKTTTGKGSTQKTTSSSQTLSFSLATGDAPELKASADFVADTWRALGADVTVKIFEIGDLNANVIEPRQYDALLFGEIVGHDPDPFAFWDSSQRNDPGLNVALYANAKTDKTVEAARQTTDPALRAELLATFQGEVRADTPAVFLYAPSFLSIMPKNLKGFRLDTVSMPSDRFADIEKWYLETDRVWKWLAPKEQSSDSVLNTKQQSIIKK
jgi:peptide/nickel transport system substrate-binding protein